MNQRAASRTAWWLLAPALAFVSLFFFVLPVLALLAGAFKLDGAISLSNFTAFFAEPLHQQV